MERVNPTINLLAHGPASPGPAARGTANRARGFTLQETALAIIIVSIGFVAAMELFSACTKENQQSSRITTAQLLAANIQEMTASLPLKDPFYAATNFGAEPGESQLTWNDVDDFDGATFTPPYDATRAIVPELAQYTQKVYVMQVDPNQTGGNTDPDNPTIPIDRFTGAVRMRVIIEYRTTPTDPPQEVLKTAWVRLDN
jgi:type II secretory pathway pseudopilin PulG